MIGAIYSRKSKFTGKGESIENQVELCKQHGKNLGITEFLIYEDEGFSGGNTHRPKFQEMLKDAKNKKFDVLICYRLDRVSRNIADFSLLIQELQKYNIAFVSIREQFDTSSPMGRAMMYIASVFAQLERETIAERIRDNMLELAKSGRWLGGQTPLGYDSEQITYLDSEFKERKMCKLIAIKRELQIVKTIFEQYKKTKSLSQVSKYLLSRNIKGKNGGDFTKGSVNDILKNPVYVKADEEVMDYLESKGILTAGTPDGKKGILTYNKRSKGVEQDKSEWIAAVSKHNGIVDSQDWLEIQETLKDNKTKAPNLGKTHTALLTGLLKCGKCGSGMRVTYGKVNKKTGKRTHYYTCSMKNNSGGTRCDCKNVRGDQIEEVVIQNLKNYDKTVLRNELNSIKEEMYNSKNDKSSEIKEINSQIEKNEKSIQILIKQLTDNDDVSIAKYFMDEMKSLNSKNKDLKKKIEDLSDNNNIIDVGLYNFEIYENALMEFKNFIDTSKEVEHRRYLIGSVVDKILWYSDSGDIEIQLWGSGKKK